MYIGYYYYYYTPCLSDLLLVLQLLAVQIACLYVDVAHY